MFRDGRAASTSMADAEVGDLGDDFDAVAAPPWAPIYLPASSDCTIASDADEVTTAWMEFELSSLSLGYHRVDGV